MHPPILAARASLHTHHCPAWGHAHASACNWDAAVAGMNKTGPLSWLILAVLVAALFYFGPKLFTPADRR